MLTIMRSATPLSLLFAPLCLLGLMGCPEDVDEADPDASDKVVIPAFENAIVASDQLPDDLTIITVERVDLDAPGYIVVREALPASPDLPGKTIAIAPVQRSASNLKVTLDRPAVPGERLFATLHVESNDNDSFNFDQTPGIDPPALDVLGLPASASFSINLPPPGAITVEDQGVMARVWADEVIISSVTSPQRRSLLALHTSLDDLTRPVGVIALSTFSSEQVPITLNAPVPHNTKLFAVLHQDLGAQESFDADLDLPILQNDAPISTSFTVTLDPTPSASLTCTLDRALCTAPSLLLPLDIALKADHDGELLVRYTDTTGEPREALYPVSALDTSTSDLMLPTAACDTAFEVSLLVSVDGVDPLTAATLPFATNADGAPVTCTVAEQPADLVSDIIVDPADTLSLTSTIAGFSLLQNASAFITVSSVDAMVEPTDEDIDAELLGVIQQTERVQDLTIQLNRPLIEGELVLIAAHDDQNTIGVFEAEQVLRAFGKNPAPIDPEMMAPPVYLQSSHVIEAVGTSEPFLTVTGEPAADINTLSVRQSVAQGAALVVVFDDGGGRPGDPLGFGAVPAGVNQDISVTLSRDTIAEETLYVLLLDDDGNQIYDDIFTDPVFVRDAAPVMQVVTVGGNP